MLPRAVTRVGLLATFDSPTYHQFIRCRSAPAPKIRGVHPPLSQWCPLHITSYFQKIINFHPYFCKIYKFPLFSFNLIFWLNLRFFGFPYFDHAAFMHHAFRSRYLLGDTVKLMKFRFLMLILRILILFLSSENWTERWGETAENFPVKTQSQRTSKVKKLHQVPVERNTLAIRGPHRTVEFPPYFYIFMIWKLYFVIRNCCGSYMAFEIRQGRINALQGSPAIPLPIKCSYVHLK